MTDLSMSNAAMALPRALSNLEHILRKGEANAIERGIDPQIFMDTRLTPERYRCAYKRADEKAQRRLGLNFCA